jgi:hypothetical protein
MLFEDLLPQLLGEAPGCPDVTAINALRRATIEFCERTHAWSELQEDPTPLEEGVHTYEIEAPAGARVELVLEVWVNGAPLTGKSMAEIGRLVPGWQTATANRPVYFNAEEGENQLRLFPIPAALNGELLTARVAYAPTSTSNRIADSVANKDLEALISGALGRLMVMPNKAWSNAPLASYHLERFEAAITKRRIKKAHGNVSSSLSVAPRAFG